MPHSAVTTWVINIVAVCVLALAALTYFTMVKAEDAVGRIQTPASQRRSPMYFETEWKDAQGVVHRVRTDQMPSETVEECARRHAEAVAALQAIYPPV